MNYKDAFAVDSIHFTQRKEECTKIKSEYLLNNFDYYEPKLIDDFYLKYFTRKLLFEIDILNVEEFLQYQYDYCEDPDKYFSILDLKILPKIYEIVESAQLNLEGLGCYYNEVKLDDGFIESEGVIHNPTYDYSWMLHNTACLNRHNDLRKRAEIITLFLSEYKDKSTTRPLKWIAGPSQLAIIFRELVDKGYIEAEKSRGEINSAKFSRNLFKAFSIDDCDSHKSIEIYLSPGNKRYKKAKDTFDTRGFSILDSENT